MSKTFTEKSVMSNIKVDRSGAYPRLIGVSLCGPTSSNRRRYNREAFAGSRVNRYDGRPVFLNHSQSRGSRRYEDKIAVIENPRLRADGMPIGDLAVNPKHPYSEMFLHDAEHHPSTVGMSHCATCKTKNAPDGIEEIVEILSVESVDVVLDPATVAGLFEQVQRRRMQPTQSAKRMKEVDYFREVHLRMRDRTPAPKKFSEVLFREAFGLKTRIGPTEEEETARKREFLESITGY